MNVFLVTSPLQYIVALEAKRYFACKNCLLLLVNQDTAHGMEQQNKLFCHDDWDYVIQIDRSNRSIQIPKVIKQIRRQLNGKSIDCFFYAEYNGWRTKLMIRNLPIEQEVYFDDGTMTLLEYPKFILPKTVFYRPRFLQDLIVKLQGCQPVGRLEQSGKLDIFTMFDLKSAAHRIHKNTFEGLKEHYGNPDLYNAEAPIGYIGQGAIGDKGQKPVQEYVDELVALSKTAKRHILYFPHRTEREDVRRTLMDNEHIIYHRSEYPLEIELIDKHIELSGLVGTYSTVMFTCRLLYPDMPIYTISNDYPDSNLRDELQRQFKAINVQKINRFDSL
ncbi:glycosyltransferase 52 family protein [Photobacterium damselae]